MTKNSPTILHHIPFTITRVDLNQTSANGLPTHQL